MSIRDEWQQRDELHIEGDRFKVRCRSTFSGTRSDFVADLERAVSNGLLDGAVHLEVAQATMGELWSGDSLLEAIAVKPNPLLRTLSLGSLLGSPDLPRLSARWPAIERAFSALEHGPADCWRAATNPRVRVGHVGPHFVKVRPNQAFLLEANGVGPWLALRDAPLGDAPLDVLALTAAVSSNNVAAVELRPLEAGDEVRLNGRPVKVHPLSINRNGAVLRKGTVQLFPLRGDVIEVAGLGVRYEEDDRAGQIAFSARSTGAVLMGKSPSNVTVTLDLPAPAPEEDDD